MKKSESIKFANACITLEEGVYKITETKKEDVFVYNLTDVLGSYLDVENISLQLGKTEDIESEE